VCAGLTRCARALRGARGPDALLGTGPSGWYEHSMTGGAYLVRRRHVDHGLVRTCACPGSRWHLLVAAEPERQPAPPWAHTPARPRPAWPVHPGRQPGYKL